MPSDLQVSNIKDLTGSNTGLSIASDGQVTIAQNNPTITLGSNAVFPTGSLVKSTIIQITSGNETSTTTTHAAVFTYKQVTCTIGNTIIFDISFGGEAAKHSGNSSLRIAEHRIYQKTTSVSAGTSDDGLGNLGTQLNEARNGRTLTGSSGAGADGFFFTTFRGVFVATASSHYFGMSHACLDTTATKTGTFMTSTRPLTITVTELKGDVLT